MAKSAIYNHTIKSNVTDKIYFKLKEECYLSKKTLSELIRNYCEEKQVYQIKDVKRLARLRSELMRQGGLLHLMLRDKRFKPEHGEAMAVLSKFKELSSEIEKILKDIN